MGIQMIRAGLSSSIQDAGRIGYASVGVPESGFMDPYLAHFANLLVGNSKDTAVLEMTLLGCKLKFDASYRVVICGLESNILLNDKNISLNKAFIVQEGDVLDISQFAKGNFAYLAIYGGFQTEEVLGSKSQYKGITSHPRLQKGDYLQAQALLETKRPKNAEIQLPIDHYSKKEIQVYPGPEWAMLSSEIKEGILSRDFTLTADSSRMAFLFKEKVSPTQIDLLTSAVLPGTVQLTSGGRLILLMRDAQVTGGYPRILQVAEEDLAVVAQKRAGEIIRFQLGNTKNI